MSERCNSCPGDVRFIDSYGNESNFIAVVGVQPSEAHPEDSDAAFALDLDRTQRSSEILEQVFDELDLSFDDFYWTNVVKCVDVDGDTANLCSTATARELSAFGKVIVLGHDAYELLKDFGFDNLERIWHPAYILRSPHKMDEYVEQWGDVIGNKDQGKLSSFG